MKNCAKDITNYHQERVTLQGEQRTALRDRRNANRDRLRRGLEEAEEPNPEKFVSQGSYAMRTTIQEPENHYDIDDGVVFDRESLKGPQGADKTALDARKMVRDAVHDGSFNSPPKVMPNCVRVFYNDGPHVDIPVYRKVVSAHDSESFELASADWKASDPEGVNTWFSQCLDDRSDSARAQFRELIRLLKSFCKNRPSYSLPSGFVLSVLVNEAYSAYDDRLDRAFRSLIVAVRDRLASDLHVHHPVVDEWLIDENTEHKSSKLKTLLGSAVETLEELDLPNCLRSRALKAWKKVFATDYFDTSITEAEQEEKKTAAAAVAAVADVGPSPKPWCPK